MEKNLFKNKVFFDNDSYSNFFKYGAIFLITISYGLVAWGGMFIMLREKI